MLTSTLPPGPEAAKNAEDVDAQRLRGAAAGSVPQALWTRRALIGSMIPIRVDAFAVDGRLAVAVARSTRSASSEAELDPVLRTPDL